MTPYVTSVSILGETIEFALREFIKKTERERIPAEKKKDSLCLHDYEKYDYNPSGRLSLIITNYIITGIRRNWSGGKKQRVEDSLHA
jgi:hypothetical protein